MTSLLKRSLKHLRIDPAVNRGGGAFQIDLRKDRPLTTPWGAANLCWEAMGCLGGLEKKFHEE